MQVVNAVKNLIQQRLHHVLWCADGLLVRFCRPMKLYDMLHNSYKYNTQIQTKKLPLKSVISP